MKEFTGQVRGMYRELVAPKDGKNGLYIMVFPPIAGLGHKRDWNTVKRAELVVAPTPPGPAYEFPLQAMLNVRRRSMEMALADDEFSYWLTQGDIIAGLQDGALDIILASKPNTIYPFIGLAKEPFAYVNQILAWKNQPERADDQYKFAPLFRELDEKFPQLVGDVPRKWLVEFHRIMNNMQPLDPLTGELKSFLVANPER